MIDDILNTFPNISIRTLCATLSISRGALYREKSRKDQPIKIGHSTRALSDQEHASVLMHLHSERFIDRSPQEVYATLLDEGEYLCSIRTMYRILNQEKEVRERRLQKRHPKYAKPELLANGPNQLWSWDITQLKGPWRGLFYYLYAILDVFSRYITGWMVADHQLASHSERLIRETCVRQNIDYNQLIIHSDNGKQMNAKNVSQLVASLGLTQSFSRPHVSNDNPYSESHSKTLKYFPDFPERFGSMEDALSYCRRFFQWYNTEHRHSGLGLLTPHSVHYGESESILMKRSQILSEAYQNNPERFVHGCPKPVPLPKEVWINKPKELDNSV
jgi:putative transposase